MSDEMMNQLANYIAVEMLKQPDRKIDPDEKLISSGIIDSFSLVDLALFVEDTFGVLINDSELNADTFDTLNQLVELIKSRQG